MDDTTVVYGIYILVFIALVIFSAVLEWLGKDD